MAYRFLKGSTALTVVLSLALPPLPLMAQTGAGDAADPAQEAAPVLKLAQAAPRIRIGCGPHSGAENSITPSWER